MIFTNKNVIEYGKAKNCHICERNITQKRIDCKGQAAHSYCGEKDRERKVNWKEIYREEICSICQEPFEDEKERDHCHELAVYNICRLQTADCRPMDSKVQKVWSSHYDRIEKLSITDGQVGTS